MHTLTYTITNFPDMYMTQTMETNFPDVLNEDESVQLFMDIVGNGRGMTMWARTYVVPIATRYLYRHRQVLFEIQSARRQPIETDVTGGCDR